MRYLRALDLIFGSKEVKIQKIFASIVVLLIVGGCTAMGDMPKNWENPFVDKTALSTLGADRLKILSFDPREKRLVENYLQEILSVKKAGTDKKTFPRSNEDQFTMISILGEVYTPKTPIGMECRKLKLEVKLSTGENIKGNSIMCLDTINSPLTWERTDK